METHINALTRAANELGINCDYLDETANLLRLRYADQQAIFQSNHTPFNSEALAGICLDKGHTYQLLRDVLPMPRTLAILDFALPARHRHYLRFQTIEDALRGIEEQFHYPLVIKRNRGALANHVFLCEQRDSVVNALEQIFNRLSHRFDFIALAQEFLPAAREYRVVYYQGEVVFAYERIIDGEDFKAAYWTRPGGRPELINDAASWQRFQAFAAAIFYTLPLGFVGVDILETHDGQWRLLELNSAPRFDHIAEVAGLEPVVAMYRRILERYFQMRSAL